VSKSAEEQGGAYYALPFKCRLPGCSDPERHHHTQGAWENVCFELTARAEKAEAEVRRLLEREKDLTEALERIAMARHFYKVTANRETEPNLFKVQSGAQAAVSVLCDQADTALSALNTGEIK
jgi:hypothetical protein